MNLPPAYRTQVLFALLLVAAFILLYPLLTWAAGGYASRLVILMQKEIELLRPAYHFQQLRYVSSGPQAKTIQMKLKVVVDPTNRKSGARLVKGYYPAKMFIIQPLIVLAVLFAWPSRSWSKKLFSLLLGLGGLFLAMMIDVPFQLIHVIQNSMNEYGPVDYRLNAWVKFLAGGGRLLITIIIIIGALMPYRPIKEIYESS